MKHPILKILQAKPLIPYKIEVEFDNGKKKIIDLEPILFGTLFGQLQNWQLFRKVRVNKEVQTVEWPNGADFDPATLYYWEKHKKELFMRAKKWD